MRSRVALGRAMRANITSHKDAWFAVAVRDLAGLWLYLEIKRSRKSDVYVFSPHSDQGELHVSYHKDGHWWVTSSKNESEGHRQQKSDVLLQGSERVLTTPIHLNGVRALNVPCFRGEYTGIFAISSEQISPKWAPLTTSLAIDLAEPGVLPPVPSVIERVIFTDAVPHIHVALWNPADVLMRLEQNVWEAGRGGNV